MNFICVDIEDITKFKNLFLGINFKKYTGVLNTIFTEKDLEKSSNLFFLFYSFYVIYVFLGPMLVKK